MTGKRNIEQRALSAYYRSGGVDHPAHDMTGRYFVACEVGKNTIGEVVTGFREYIRLANVNGTLAVYRINNWDELKRLKRWPASIEDGSAMTEAQFNAWVEQQERAADAERRRIFDDPELADLLDTLDGLPSAEPLCHSPASDTSA